MLGNLSGWHAIILLVVLALIVAFVVVVVLIVRATSRAGSRVAPSAQTMAQQPAAAARLAELEGLRVQGLVTADEYEMKRADILSEL